MPQFYILDIVLHFLAGVSAAIDPAFEVIAGCAGIFELAGELVVDVDHYRVRVHIVDDAQMKPFVVDVWKKQSVIALIKTTAVVNLQHQRDRPELRFMGIVGMDLHDGHIVRAGGHHHIGLKHVLAACISSVNGY